MRVRSSTRDPLTTFAVGESRSLSSRHFLEAFGLRSGTALWWRRRRRSMVRREGTGAIPCWVSARMRAVALPPCRCGGDPCPTTRAQRSVRLQVIQHQECVCNKAIQSMCSVTNSRTSRPILRELSLCPACIKATAFFPGGTGLWDTQPHRPLPPMPSGESHDSRAGFLVGSRLLPLPGPRPQRRASGNVDLAQSPVAPRTSPCPCARPFFTNMYMGLRAGNAKLTGRFPGARSPHFVHQCQMFLAVQIAAQHPRLILTLGVQVPAIMAP